MISNKRIFGAVIGAGFLAVTMTSASALIACSGNVCWHVKEKHDYPSDSRVKVYEDNWKWGPNEKYTWREREGRGYWREDKWITW